MSSASHLTYTITYHPVSTFHKKQNENKDTINALRQVTRGFCEQCLHHAKSALAEAKAQASTAEEAHNRCVSQARIYYEDESKTRAEFATDRVRMVSGVQVEVHRSARAVTVALTKRGESRAALEREKVAAVEAHLAYLILA